MKNKFLHIVHSAPLFIFLLPVFFVLHGAMQNFNYIPLGDGAFLAAVYIGASLLIAGLSWLLYRNILKASIVAFSLMAFNLFFGSVHDWLRKTFPNTFLEKYVFILPASLILLILLIVFLKKRKRPLLKLAYYLNVLFIVLIIIDLGILATKITGSKKKPPLLSKEFIKCDSCGRPDIYFILADEYAGNNELISQFSFNDSDFLNKLTGRSFHVIPNSHSNYNYTPFSVASILNMNYLELTGTNRGKSALVYCYEKIRDNELLHFLQNQGYDFYNYSVFDFEGQPARTRETFLPLKTRLITAQTFLNRFDKELRFNFFTRFQSKNALRMLTYYNKLNNENIYDKTWELAKESSAKPRFVYTHLMMPHYPYYFDRNGKEYPFDQLTEGNQVNKAHYIEYLQYANKKLLALVDHIIASSKNPPLIVVMGDHGFRHFTEAVPQPYYFLNLSAFHLPSKDYAGIPDSLNGVNLFRTILNKEFGQQLPYLKDSTTYLAD